MNGACDLNPDLVSNLADTQKWLSPFPPGAFLTPWERRNLTVMNFEPSLNERNEKVFLSENEITAAEDLANYQSEKYSNVYQELID